MVPGITSRGIEVFVTDGKLYIAHNCTIKLFEDISSELKNYFKGFIDEKAEKGFELLRVDESERLKKFLECRYGNLDRVADFDDVETSADFVVCDKKNFCPAYGYLCVKKLYDLTSREIEVVKLIGEDLPDKQIADKLKVNYTTLVTHRSHIENKLKCGSKVGVARFAYKHNLVPD